MQYLLETQGFFVCMSKEGMREGDNPHGSSITDTDFGVYVRDRNFYVYVRDTDLSV